MDVTHEKLFSDQLPTRIVVRLVNNQAFNGDLGSNTFNFAHAKTLENGTAKYPIRRVVCKTFAVPQTIWTSPTRNCFPISYPLASW